MLGMGKICLFILLLLRNHEKCGCGYHGRQLLRVFIHEFATEDDDHNLSQEDDHN